MNQQQIVDYLREENRVLRAQILTRRLRLDDNQRRRLLGDTESGVADPEPVVVAARAVLSSCNRRVQEERRV